MLRSGLPQSFETGLAAYKVGATVAAHQLSLGMSVVADAANYLEVGRQIWWAAAEQAGVAARAIDVVCSDEDAHRARLAGRRRDLGPFPEPTWETIVQRRTETEPWTRDHLILDSVQPIADNVVAAVEYLTV